MLSFGWRGLVLQTVSIITACGLFSCASTSPPQEVKVSVPDGYSGHLRVSLCVANPGKADGKGNINVSDCPQSSDRVELIVSRGGKIIRIPFENLSILKTGDKIPVQIDAQLP